jgi:acyl-CoA thioesterase
VTGPFELRFGDSRTRSSFVVEPALQRHDGTLYGGTAIAASILAMEAATERSILWVTTQFVSPAPGGSTIDVNCEALASGKRISQLRVEGTVGAAVAFTSLGATGTPRPNGIEGQFEVMPKVPAPDGAAPLFPGPPSMAEEAYEQTFRRICEYRTVEIGSTTRGGEGTMAMWTRFKDGRPMTAAGVAFCADMVPIAIARGAAKQGAGMSLDNSLRFAEVPPVEWVLLELQGNMAAGGYGHGIVRVWTEDGQQVAIGGQTASMIYVFEEGLG